MSLLEDVFLQDEANEAEQLERVIEGDEFEERRRSDSDENSEKEDEAEEDKRKVDPTKTRTARVVKNPRVLLNPARLTGPRGIQVIPEHFKDFKFRGKGHEKEDLDLVLKRLEHWAYRLYPKFQFEDCLKKIEMLGKKRPVAVHLHKIRSDQFLSEDTVVQKDSSDEDTPMPVQEEDEFDKLLQQQIDLARSTPAPKSAKKPTRDGSISPKDKRTTSLMMPKATSSPSINDEQRERMLRSRRLAEERRLARLKNAVNSDKTAANGDSMSASANLIVSNTGNRDSNTEQSKEKNNDTDEIATSKKHNRSNGIDSSDEETAVEMSVSTTVDVHTTNKIAEEHNRSNIIDASDAETAVKISVSTTVDIHSANMITEEESVGNNIKSTHIDNATEKSANTICDSRAEYNKLIANANERIDKESSEMVGSEYDNVNSILNGNMREKADKTEENKGLTYDDSDVDTDLNVPDKVNDNVQNINEKDVEIEERENLSNDGEFVSKELVKESLTSVEVTSENDLKAPDNASNDYIHIETNKMNVVPEEISDDIMDVDFSDDF